MRPEWKPNERRQGLQGPDSDSPIALVAFGMDKMQAVSAVIGALYTLATALHVFFPNVALFQRFGAALLQLGPKS